MATLAKLRKERVTQREAMRYVGESAWSKFKAWRDRHRMPFTKRGRQTLYRISELDKAMQADEANTAEAIRKGRETAEAFYGQR